MNYWLMKTEPDVFSIDDLKERGREPWDGVRNYEARNFMRDAMRPGDAVLFYHSNASPSAVVGIAEVGSDPYPDPTQFDESSDYYDAKATCAKPRWHMIEVAYVRHLARPVALSEIKANASLAEMALLKRSRLSVCPVKPEEFDEILRMADEEQP
ncbi:MAG: EVE domain-containing protein [Bradymonadaceae bacterium]|nr:EVE domain-containing protein [Lujinxingiaceae bacterium]